MRRTFLVLEHISKPAFVTRPSERRGTEDAAADRAEAALQGCRARADGRTKGPGCVAGRSRNGVLRCALGLFFLVVAHGGAETEHAPAPAAVPHPPSATPTPTPTPLSDVERLKAELARHAVDGDWWTLAQRLLDKLERPDAERFLESLTGDSQHAALQGLIRARFVLAPDELRAGTDEAAKSEWKRRLTEDPNVSLLASLFNERRESAINHEDALRKAIEAEDEGRVAELAVNLIYSLNVDQKRELLKALQAEAKKPEVLGSPRRLKLVQRLLWATQELFGQPRGDSAVANGFKDKIASAFAKADEKGKRFYENLDKAASGDEAALKSLIDTYGAPALLDFMASQKDFQNGDLAIRLAHTLGWKDVNGDTHLDLKVESPVSAPSASPAEQTWTLGKTDDEIRKALHGFDLPAGHAGGSPVTPSGFQTVTLNPTPALSGQRHFFKLGETGGHVVPYTPHVLFPEDKRFCEAGEVTPTKVTPLSQAAGWFFRPFPDSHYGSYAGSRQHGVGSPHTPTGNENVLVDTSTGREMPIPGPYDPVPTADELYMTMPLDAGLTFYDMKSLINGRPKELFTDKDMGGVYQSIGTLGPSEKGTAHYRIITDLNGMSVRDYEISRAPGGEAVVRPLGKPKRLCPDHDLALPMLSKDGKWLSAVDLKTHTTKIFDIDNDKCDEKIDLGMFTSKVDFSYDKKLITFHKMNNEQTFNPAHPYTRVPSDDYVANVYVYNLETGELGRLTGNTDSNAVYPAFRRDGKITFIQHPHQGGEHRNSNLVEVDPASARRVTFDQLLPTSDTRPNQDSRLKAIAALGALWSQLCSPHGGGISMESATLATLNLDPQRCKAMVEKYWKGLRKQVSETKSLDNKRFKADALGSLTDDNLKAACPSAVSATITPAPSPSAIPSAGEGSVVPTSCRHCHNPSSRFPIPWDDPGKIRTMASRSPRRTQARLVDEIMARIRSTGNDYRMPPIDEDVPMTPAEVTRLGEYLGH